MSMKQLSEKLIADGHQIAVTDKMLAAGKSELFEHNFSEDIDYLLGCVFMAMAYESMRGVESDTI